MRNNLFNTVSALAIMIGMRHYRRRHATTEQVVRLTGPGYYYHPEGGKDGDQEVL